MAGTENPAPDVPIRAGAWALALAAAAAAAEPATRPARKEEERVADAERRIEKVRKADASVRIVSAGGRPVAGARVAVVQTRHDFLFGCNIYGFDRCGTERENEAYKRRFAELFNYATTGFYWRSYEPVRGKPDYAYTDKVVAWCRKHGIRLKGHPLLWGHRAGIPAWSDGQPDPAAQRKRVTENMQRYAGKIEFWEVVNEPAHLKGLKIDQPYRWARQADPKAHLIVNDYYVMATGYRPFLELLRQAQADGMPFDGVGIQAHEPRTMRFGLDQVGRFLDLYAGLGVDLHITEFTPCSAGQKITGSHLTGPKAVWDEAAQADYAVKFYKACFAHPAVVAITWWDLCDKRSWLKGGGMLREDFTCKPVYTALKKLIHEDWTTRCAGDTGPDGLFRFRGFHGSYAVKAAAGPGEAQAEAVRRLSSNGPNAWTVKLPARP